MPPPKDRSPKDLFYERGRQLLKDAENSKDPTLAKLRAEAGKRYLAKDVLGNAKVPPGLALFIGVAYLVAGTAASVYYANASGTFAAALVAIILLGLILLVFLLALTGVMTEASVAKIIVRMWDKVVAKLKP